LGCLLSALLMVGGFNRVSTAGLVILTVFFGLGALDDFWSKIFAVSSLLIIFTVQERGAFGSFGANLYRGSNHEVNFDWKLGARQYRLAFLLVALFHAVQVFGAFESGIFFRALHLLIFIGLSVPSFRSAAIISGLTVSLLQLLTLNWPFALFLQLLLITPAVVRRLAASSNSSNNSQNSPDATTLDSALYIAGEQRTVVFYDGECGFCHNSIKLIIAELGEANKMTFATRGSQLFARLKSELTPGLDNLPDSIVVVSHEKKIITLAMAPIFIMERLGGIWRYIGSILQLLPEELLNIAYRFVATVRCKLANKPDNVCPIIPQKFRSFFAE